MLHSSRGPEFTLRLGLTPPGILVTGKEAVGTREEKTELEFGSVLLILLQFCACGT